MKLDGFSNCETRVAIRTFTVEDFAESPEEEQ